MSNEKPSFSALIQSGKPVLVDFMATWCGPCKTMAPILKQAKEQLGDQITIIKIDVDRNPQVAQVYQISSVPTLVLFKSGAPVWRQSGVVPLHRLINSIQSFT